MNWEIEKAFKQGKTIVGVWEWGSKGCEIPEALEECYNAIVGWNGKNIIDAINGDYEERENPEGICTNIPTPITRHPCS